MSRFHYAPPTDKLTSWGSVQTLELHDGREPIARATWQPVPGVAGAYQVLWAEVIESQRRRGNGTQLLAEVIRQARLHATAAGTPLRRMMALLEQPNLVARAWLMRNGFVHVKTLDDLAPRHEVLVMIRTMT